MSNFSKLKEMWENKNKPQQQVPPCPTKPAAFKSTFQPNAGNNLIISNGNNHLSLPQNSTKTNNILNTEKQLNKIIENQQAKQPKINQQTKQGNQAKKIEHPVIGVKQLQRPKTMVIQNKQPQKPSKIAEMKNLFESIMPMGFQNNPQNIRANNKQKQNQKQKQRQHQNLDSNKQKNQNLNFKIDSSEPSIQNHPKVEVEYQANKMSFQQRRKMAQELLKNKQLAKINYETHKNQHEKPQNHNQNHHHDHEKQLISKKQNVIQLEQQIYYFDEESRQATKKADLLSNNIFMSALNKKPFYESNEGSMNGNSNNLQIKKSVSQVETVTNLQVRKPKPKKRNLQDFDDA